ncbi:tetratricopeptide repeat-containing sensor histidine kinase [uncultured Maribacter sp.]|uniref:tetratricopeptide repeat-containing sensor histidine kinase n=1 Tax=uncultured Maribacter sp. TaxID=431308 RepID=UPI0030D8221E|tara:strand:+ start:80 stop:2134 length:2055 start_codon:yes stop_codon:yes gene_type:complete
MIFKLTRKYIFLLFAFICINVNTTVAQVDSIQFFKEKIKTFSQGSNNSENSTSYIDLINNLSYQLRYSGLDTMKIVTVRALELSNSINYKEGELEALTNFSAFYLYRGDTKNSIEYCQKLLNDKELIDYPIIGMKVYNHLGQAYFIKQDYPLSYTYFLQGLALGEKHKNEFYTFLMNMNLGTMFNLLEDYDEAMLFYTSAFESSKKTMNANMDAMLSSNLAFLYIQTGDFDKAKNYLNKSIDYFEYSKNKEWLAFSLSTLAQLYLKLKNYNDAINNYQKALSVHSSDTDIKGRADIYYGLARSYFEINNLTKAEENINKSLSLYSSFNLNTGLEKCYRILYQIKKEQNQISKSLEYFELTEKLANDIFIEKNKRNLNMLNTKLNFEKEKDDLKAKNELAIDQQRKYVKWSLAALLTSFIIVLIILNSVKREKLLNRKLENQAIVLKENQKTLSNINQNQDRLFSIVGHDLRGPIISLKELLILYIEDPEGKMYFEKFAPQLRDDLEQVQFTMDNLLHWGKNQMIGSSIKLERISVSHEIENILHFFNKEIKKKYIKIDNQIIENHCAFADLDQFNVIFRNLISNAIKFTPNEGKITLTSKIKYANLLIKISDTGVGMSELTLSKLFKDTEHISTSGTNLEKGTGLGLRLAKEMIIKNNGEISVKSKINEGSHFIVELPLSITRF